MQEPSNLWKNVVVQQWRSLGKEDAGRQLTKKLLEV